LSTATVKRYLSLGERPIASAATLGPSLTPTTLRYQARQASRPAGRRTDEIARRILNIAVALVGIVLTAPLMLAIAVLVKLTSKGPVLYTQPRVGIDRRAGGVHGGPGHRRKSDHGGRIFTIFKFRTMRSHLGPARQVWAGENDPRITPVGRILRRTRLDELPQLFNVLKGDMNIVGPRPEQPEIFARLTTEVGHYRRRQRVLPGITGLAQVSLSYDATVEDVKKKVALDLEYIQKRSPAHDLLIMAKTMPVMVFRQGSR
jgi:lipopolysaccharide/colanic/teichoic acid biosynthesis glycosyltransferase